MKVVERTPAEMAVCSKEKRKAGSSEAGAGGSRPRRAHRTASRPGTGVCRFRSRFTSGYEVGAQTEPGAQELLPRYLGCRSRGPGCMSLAAPELFILSSCAPLSWRNGTAEWENRAGCPLEFRGRGRPAAPRCPACHSSLPLQPPLPLACAPLRLGGRVSQAPGSAGITAAPAPLRGKAGGSLHKDSAWMPILSRQETHTCTPARAGRSPEARGGRGSWSP